jgi:signal transduction histidine kinase
VLDFSRLRTGNLEMKKSRFDLTELVRSICDRVSKMSGVEGYTVIFDGREPCYVEADSGRIGQVIYNLLGNALTYTGKDRTVRVREEQRGEKIRISIADSGEGIAPDELPYIWDRYYRSRENHRRAVIGSGLGLNICRGILEKHEAPYGVRSEPGEGTTFWFRLPVVKNPG